MGVTSAEDSVECFGWVILFNPAINTSTAFNLEMGKLRLREAKQLAQDHTIYQRWNLIFFKKVEPMFQSFSFYKGIKF